MATDAISRFEIAPDTSTAAPSTTVAPAQTGGDAISRFQVAPGTSSTTPPTGWTDVAGDALRYGTGVLGSFVHGLSFGLDRPLDRLTAAIFPNSSFARMQAENEQAQKGFETQHPVVSTLAQTAGSIPTYVITEGALAGSGLPVLGGTGFVGSAARNAGVNAALEAGTTDGSLADRGKAGLEGAAVGAIAGPVGDIAGRVISKPISAFTGGAGGASAADARLAQKAIDKYKIPITAPDMSSNPIYRISNDQLSHLPFSGAGPAAEAKLGAWRGAILNEMGEPGETAATSDVMQRAKGRIGQVFDDVATRTSISPVETAAMTHDLNTVEANARLTLPESELTPLTKQLENIREIVNRGNGTISGAQYQALTRAKAPLDLAENSPNSNVRHFAGQIRDALDDAFARSSSPADQEALAKAKYQYRIMRTIDPLVAGSRDGTFTPDAFMQKVVTASRRFDSPTGGKAYTGGGNIGELADIGKLMRASPQTGSGDRMLVNLLATGGATGGLAALTNPTTSLAVPGGLLANNLAQRYLRSPMLAKRVISSSLNPAATARYAPFVVPLTNALAGGNIPIQ